jgi:hypothetical protein
MADLKTIIGTILTDVGDSLSGNKKNPNTVQPSVYVPPVVTPAPAKSKTGLIVGLVLGAAVIGGIFIYIKKNKK